MCALPMQIIAGKRAIFTYTTSNEHRLVILIYICTINITVFDVAYAIHPSINHLQVVSEELHFPNSFILGGSKDPHTALLSKCVWRWGGVSGQVRWFLPLCLWSGGLLDRYVYSAELAVLVCTWNCHVDYSRLRLTLSRLSRLKVDEKST
jgi:hypothetical protein